MGHDGPPVAAVVSDRPTDTDVRGRDVQTPTPWFAPRRAMRALARPMAAAVLVAGAVTGVAGWADGWSRSNAVTAAGQSHRIETLEADYRLGRTADGAASLEATERLGVVFLDPPSGSDGRPSFERVLPTVVDGVRTPVTVQGVEDAEGRAVPFTVDEGETSVTVTVGLPDGVATASVDDTAAEPSTYVLRYRADDVVADSAGGGTLRWPVVDAAGVDEIDRVQAVVTVPDVLAPSVGEVTCATEGGDDAACTTSTTTTGGDEVTTVADDEVAAGESVEVSARTTAGAFTPGSADAGAVPETLAVLGVGGLSLVAAGGAVWLAATRRRRRLGDHVAIAGSVVPRGLSPALAGSLYGSPGRGVVGQLLQAAVDGDVVLRPGDEDVLVELVRWPDDLDPAADRALAVLVPRVPTGRPESLRGRLTLASDADLARVRDSAVRAKLVDRGDPERAGRWLGVAGGVGAVGLPLASHAAGVGLLPGTVALAATLVSVGAGWGVAHSWQRWSARGTETLGYLEGLKLYLAKPQLERIALLQKQTGPGHLVSAAEEAELYERLLPYAVVLGEEQTWLRMLGSTSGGGERRWLPDERLQQVLDAVNAADLVERLDGRLAPMEGRAAPVDRGADTGHRPTFSGVGGSGGLGGGTGGAGT
jgi:hypothetical protein